MQIDELWIQFLYKDPPRMPRHFWLEQVLLLSYAEVHLAGYQRGVGEQEAERTLAKPSP